MKKIDKRGAKAAKSVASLAKGASSGWCQCVGCNSSGGPYAYEVGNVSMKVNSLGYLC